MITDHEGLNEVIEFGHLTKLIIGHGEIQAELPNLPYMRRFLQPQWFFDRIGNDSAAIIYSSGSTGRPKGCVRTGEGSSTRGSQAAGASATARSSTAGRRDEGRSAGDMAKSYHTTPATVAPGQSVETETLDRRDPSPRLFGP